MSFVYENFRLSRLISLAIFALILSSAPDASAYKEEQSRTTNNRLRSIIEGKVEFHKSSYSFEKVRVSTPKPEQFQPTPQTKYERITSSHLQNLQFIPINYKKEFIRKEGRKSFASNSKGRSESFNEDPNVVKKFCNVQVKTKFCIRNGESRSKYTGNTPKKRPRKKDFSDANNFKKKQESKAFVKKLIRQSDR
ncbi:MAG: hypothetical protein HOK56_01545 [Deltaproteobacteria bacterium]|nr:hypothetical protein [Deltaproteobacteria bacterium]